MEKYLLIFEDGSPAQVDSLDDEYCEAVADGMLTVFRFSEGAFEELQPSGEWLSADSTP